MAVRTLARGRWDGTALVEVRDLFSAIPNGNASRILFGRDGMIYMTIGVGDNEAMSAQDLNDLAGKVLRLKDDGTVPPDNPFVSRAGARPEIFTYGHRNGLGLAFSPKRARSGNAKTGRTAATKSTFCRRARITDGPWSATAGFIWGRG